MNTKPLKKREAETAVWEKYKPYIEHLYLSKSLTEVVATMTEQFGFARKYEHSIDLASGSNYD